MKKYLLLGYTETNLKADPVLTFIGTQEEALKAKENDGDCVRFDFHLITQPTFRKFVERETKPAKKKASK